MSLKYYSPSDNSGIIDLVYSNTGADAGSYPLQDITRDINLAKDNLVAIALRATGMWELDDTNNPDYPIITTNLVLGQRDYAFVADGSGNLILDIYRVMCADANGVYYDLELVDQQVSSFNSLNWQNMGMVNGQNLTGSPAKYAKTGNGIFLDSIPNYNRTGGLKLFVNREALHYVTPTVGVADDTSSGIDPRLDEYLAVRPTAYFAAKKGLQCANFYTNELLKYEGNEDRGITGMIESTYSKRSKDEPTRIRTIHHSSR